jgi:serine phosphatase RsbU (regulator of sigma subunit)/PAS domain-containing protein/ligand-binding sensor domain-containing protein
MKCISKRIGLGLIYSLILFWTQAQQTSPLIPVDAHFEVEELEVKPLTYVREKIDKINWTKKEADKTQAANISSVEFSYSLPHPVRILDSAVLVPQIIQLNQPSLIKRTGFKLPDKRSVNLKYLNVSCGLPTNEIIDMDQDEDGNIWALSNEGVFKITGSYIFHYSHQQLLPDANLEKIICHNHKIYIATFGQGLWILEDEKLLIHTKESGFYSNHIVNFHQNDSSLYINYYGEGWVELNNSGRFIHYQPETTSGEIFISSATTHLGHLFISDKGSVWQLDSSKTSFRKLTFKNLNPSTHWQLVAMEDFLYFLLPKQGVLFIQGKNAILLENEFLSTLDRLFLGKSGICWGFSEKGIVLISKDKIYRTYTQESYLSETTILNCFQDDASNLWITTSNKGIGFISPSNFSIVENLGGNLALKTIFNHSSGIYSEIYGGGIQHIDKNGNILQFYHPNLKNIAGIAATDNAFYLATTSGIYELRDEHLFKIIFPNDNGLNTHTGMVSHQDQFYVSNYNYGVLHFDGNNFWRYKNFSSEVNQVIVDTISNKVWVANAGKGLSYIHNNKVYHASKKTGFPANQVYSIAIGNNGEVYAGTAVGLFTLKNDKFYQISTPFAPQGKVTSCLFEPSRQEVWANTSSQILKIRPNDNYYITRYNQNEIPSFGNIPKNGLFVDGEDVLFIMDNTVVRYMDFMFGYQKKPLTLELVAIKTRNTQTNHQREFSPNELTHFLTSFNKWNLTFTSGYYDVGFLLDVKNFGKEDGLNYYYRLNGWSDHWEGPIANDLITFSNLPPGQYTLYIKAETTDEITVEPIAISFTIETFFYQTTWFILLVFFLVALGVLLIFRAYTQFDFRNFESYTSLREIIIKLRLLGIFSLILLSSFEFFGSVYFRLFPFHGGALLIVILISAVGLGLSFLSTISQRAATYYLMIAYTLVLSVYIIRSHGEDFPVGLSVQTVVILLFARLVFVEMRTFINFLSVLVLVHVISAFIFSVHYSQSSLLYYWPMFQTSLLLLALYLVDVNAKRSVLFSNKILESSELFVLVCDEKGNIIYCNDYLKNTTRLKERDILGLGWWNFRGFDQKKRNETIGQIAQLIHSNSTANYVNSLFIDGEFLYIDWNDYVLDGKYLIGVGKNITEEHLLRLQNERLSLVAKSVSNGVLITDEHEQIEWCNEGFENIFETTLQLVRHTHAQPLLQSGEENNTYEIEYLAPSGLRKWLLVNKSKIVNKDSADGFIYVIIDISIRKTLELRLKDYAEDLEINNLLKEKLIYSYDFEQLALVSLENLIDKLPLVESGSLLLLNHNQLEFKVYSLENSVLTQRTVAVEDIKGFSTLQKLEIYIQKNLTELPVEELSKSDHFILAESAIISYVEVPIIYNRELTGVVILGFTIPYPFKERQENILKSYTRLLSVAIQKIKIQTDLADKNKNITDSLYYAKNIQNTLLPSLDEVRPYFRDLFVYYQPKDIVSGDFYWIEKINHQLIIVVGDCTGHGVPGAFITLLGQNLLNQYISEHPVVQPEEVIRFINERTYHALNKGKDTYVKDGMELAVCVYDTLSKEFRYAGVGIELTYYIDNKRHTIDAPRLMVGELQVLPTVSTHQFELAAVTKFYLSTDGYRDQLGGEPRKRYTKPRYYATLDEFKNLPLFQQPFLLNYYIQTHRGIHEQTDDILVIGFEL